MTSFCRYILFTAIIIFIAPLCCMANDLGTVVINGYVKDALTGEVLPGATVVVTDNGRGTVTNSYGFYSLTLPKGNYSLVFAFLGYVPYQSKINLQSDIKSDIALTPEMQRLLEVEVLGVSRETQRRKPVMGVEKLQGATISKLPVLFGEVDPLKTLQLLPGIAATSEGSSGFSVRGGNPDQNLLLLDEAIVYNAGHLLGFFSVFNNDAIKEVDVYKGDIPAWAGGRLSSLVDIRSRDGNMNNLEGLAGIGLISSRFMLEGPLVKEKSSFIFNARRTYMDMFLPLSPNEDIRDNKLFFYDVNFKANYILDDDNRLFVSFYNGRDVFINDLAEIDFGNRTISFRWNRLVTAQLFSNLTFSNSRYDYYLGTSGEFEAVDWRSKLTDYSLKYGFSWFPQPNEQIDFGIQSILHAISPANVTSNDENSALNEIRMATANSLESAIYASHTLQAGNSFTIRYGLRFSMFQNVGKGKSFSFDDGYNVIDTLIYSRAEVFNYYAGFEPRVGVSYLINQQLTVKGSYSNTRQYLHLASNSTSATPLDVWFTSSPNIKPQVSNQVSTGLFYKSLTNTWEHSVELFYKRVRNSIDFKDHPNLMLNEALEGEVRNGKAMARGIEFMTRYSESNIKGWIAYTLSRSERQSVWINNGNKYLSPFDHTHDVAVVLMYDFNKRINLSGNWVYFTGSPVTWPVARFDFQGSVAPLYSNRNAERMPHYHRMDISLNVKTKENPQKRFNGEWNFSVYNLYGRKNAWTINFIGDDDLDAYYREAEMTYLFSVIPSVSYTLRF